MEQLTIYNFCHLETDPLFQKIKELQTGKEFYIIEEGVTVRKGTGDLYEIETEDLHEPARGDLTCYQKLMRILNKIR